MLGDLGFEGKTDAFSLETQSANKLLQNTITIGLQVQEFEWVEKFIRDYTPRLPKEAQENALNYNLAYHYFYKGEYSEVIAQLREVEYQTPVYAPGSKLLLLRTYFEPG